MAPAPIPTRLKEMRGTLRKSRVNRREPKPPRARPRAPKSLAPEGRKLWGDLVALLDGARVMTLADVTALTLLCEVWAEYREADALVRQNGLVYESTTANGVIKRPNPAASIRADAWRRLEKMLGRFGLNPSDRTRVSERPAERSGKDPWDEVATGYFGEDKTARFLFGKRTGADRERVEAARQAYVEACKAFAEAFDALDGEFNRALDDATQVIRGPNDRRKVAREAKRRVIDAMKAAAGSDPDSEIAIRKATVELAEHALRTATLSTTRHTALTET